MKLRTAHKFSRLQHAIWPAACLVATACGGGHERLAIADAESAQPTAMVAMKVGDKINRRPGMTPAPATASVGAEMPVLQPVSTSGPEVQPLSTGGSEMQPVSPSAATTQAVVTASATPSAPAVDVPVVHGGIQVDTSMLPTAQPGISTVMLTQTGQIPPLPAEADWEAGGQFRLLCNWVKMSYDDPIVYPGKPGMAHHHTFFGNTSVDSSTTSDNIRSKGNASCRGGTINLSGYWAPSMIDTATGKPLAPKSLIVYYKTGLWRYMNDGSVIQPFPKGLKMIVGDASRSTAGAGEFQCYMPALGQARQGTVGPSIPTPAPTW